MSANMLIEHGLIPGQTLCPDEPGMENSSSIIPDTQRMTPNCPCEARTCPLHGFCEYCVQHHAELNRALPCFDLGEHCHFQHCKTDVMTELYGAEAVAGLAIAKEQKTRKIHLPLGELGISRIVYDAKSGIRFRVAAQDHYGPGITTLLTDCIIGVRALDAAETAEEGRAPYENSAKFGSNNYPLSNLNQWLNSDRDDWFSPTHPGDQPPEAGRLVYNEQPYAAKPGFLTRFSQAFRDALAPADIPVVVRTGRGTGELTTFRACAFLPSRTEMNKGDELGLAEGKTLPIFYDHYIFKAKPSAEQYEKYGRTWNPEQPEKGLLFGSPHLYDPKFGWWYYMRTPSTLYNYMVRVMSPYGSVSFTQANNDVVGIRPLVNLRSDLIVEDDGVESPVYRIG